MVILNPQHQPVFQCHYPCRQRRRCRRRRRRYHYQLQQQHHPHSRQNHITCCHHVKGSCDDGDECSELGVQVGDVRDEGRSLSAILLQAQLHPGGDGSAGLRGPLWSPTQQSPRSNYKKHART